jgi:hypothetical protein
VIGPWGVIAASLITVAKPIITRSGGWMRPETWTIHGQRCYMACAVVRMDITVFCYTSPMPFLQSRGRNETQGDVDIPSLSTTAITTTTTTTNTTQYC